MIAIHNFGIFWERKYIHFGKPGVAGTLLGFNNRVKDGADFRDQTGVYILYDKNLTPLYIGQTGSGNKKLFSRLKDHTKDHLGRRWEFFSWLGMCKVNNNGYLSLTDRTDRRLGGTASEALDEVEAILIQILEPKLNKQGPKWQDTEEFLQLIDERIEEATLSEIYERQKEIIEKLDSFKAGT